MKPEYYRAILISITSVTATSLPLHYPAFTAELQCKLKLQSEESPFSCLVRWSFYAKLGVFHSVQCCVPLETFVRISNDQRINLKPTTLRKEIIKGTNRKKKKNEPDEVLR